MTTPHATTPNAQVHIPSYEELTPPIPDVLASETVTQLAMFLGTDRQQPVEREHLGRWELEVGSCHAELYACLRGEGDLVAIARDFSPRIMRVGDGEVVLDVSGLGRLIGDPPAIARELARAAGHGARVAIATTQIAARLLAAASHGFTQVNEDIGHGSHGSTRINEDIGHGSHGSTRINEDIGHRSHGSTRIKEDIGHGSHGSTRINEDIGHGSHGSPQIKRNPCDPWPKAPCDPWPKAPCDPCDPWPNPPCDPWPKENQQWPWPDAAAAIAPLPVALLQPLETLPPGITVRDRLRPYETCERWGIATLGELAALPAADLASRLGRRGVALQRLARALDPRPFVPDADVPRFVERLELEWPIDGLEPLSFVLARLFDPLAAALERADRGAIAVRFDARLTDRSTHARVLQLPAPIRDPRVLRTLLLLDLESKPPAAAIDIIAIELDPAPARITQFSLLERAVPSPETLSTLIARLTALCGESRIGAAELVDSHRPGAFVMREFSAKRWELGVGTWELSTAVPVLRRQRVAPAIRVRAEHGRPVYVSAPRRGMPEGAVIDAAGPWRTSGEWWQTRAEGQGAGDRAERAGGQGPGAWDRDEWDVALTCGAVCRIYQDRFSERWYLDGVYD